MNHRRTKYRPHISWNMHKHNPRKLVVNGRAGPLVPSYRLRIDQYLNFVIATDRYPSLMTRRTSGGRV